MCDKFLAIEKTQKATVSHFFGITQKIQIEAERKKI